MSIWGDIAGLLGFNSGSSTAQAEAALGGGGGLAAIGASLTAFFADVTSVAMWRSLGWIAAGFILLVLGVALWIRKPLESLASLAAV